MIMTRSVDGEPPREADPKPRRFAPDGIALAVTIHQTGATPLAPEFTSCRIRRRLSELGTRTLFIEPGSPWENGYIESFNGKLRDELLNREIFYTLQEAQVLIERWRNQYNRRRPHSSLGNRPPAPELYPAPFLGFPLTAPAAFGLT
jgi:transposase InsO family protein